jgi:GH24 family phage-related lysozyme (muramidase)
VNVKRLTARVATELLSHEAIVREAYRDSVGVWTWGVGVTEASGHSVCPRYVDRPQTLRWCLEMYLRLLKETYAPVVLAAFDGCELSESEFGAALSFHYNTGAIATATWVEEWRRGDVGAARESFMNWRKPPQIISRREKERNLFFDGVWSNDGTVVELSVEKPSYLPEPTGKRPVEIRSILDELLGTK